MICSDWLPLRAKDSDKRRLCATEKQGNQRERERGRGLCLLKAWLSVYYKLKILPSLVCSRHEGWGWGGAYVCLSPQTQQLEARRLREGSTSLWGKQQVDGKACGSVFVLYMSECVCVC